MKYVVANWKMYVDAQMAGEIATRVAQVCTDPEQAPEVVLCPPYVLLDEVRETTRKSCVRLGAQDVSQEEAGPHTGEVGAEMLMEAGCTYVIVGHSERRIEEGESDETIAKKAAAALHAGLRVVLCVGESAEDRRAGVEQEIVRSQLKCVLAGIALPKPDQLLVTYEPQWAISARGSGDPAQLSDVLSMLDHIRSILKEVLDDPSSVPLLYGGSVTGTNAGTFLNRREIDGVLVGSASTKVGHLLDIIAAARHAL